MGFGKLRLRRSKVAPQPNRLLRSVRKNLDARIQKCRTDWPTCTTFRLGPVRYYELSEKPFWGIFTRRDFSDFCCNSVISLWWWKLPLGWQLILDPAQRGRPRVTSAPFNAARVRDWEKWIHHSHLFCWFENNAFLLSPQENICTLHLNTFKMTEDKSIKIWIHGQRSLSEAHVEKSRHAGRDGGQVGAADDRSSSVAAFCRRMALETVTRPGLKIVHFLASAIFSGTKYSWIRVIGGQQGCCYNFGPWDSWMDEKMTLDVSDGPALARFDGWHPKTSTLCLKRPSFYCLIHFYKRCVSSLAQMGRSPWVRSGWVSVLSVTTFFIQG